VVQIVVVCSLWERRGAASGSYSLCNSTNSTNSTNINSTITISNGNNSTNRNSHSLSATFAVAYSQQALIPNAVEKTALILLNKGTTMGKVSYRH
jgi:hypothetical protein